MNYAHSAVLENADLLTVMRKYIGEPELLPFILLLKAVRDALKPFHAKSGQQWIFLARKI